jgi:multidrug efflux system outer membrane protein
MTSANRSPRIQFTAFFPSISLTGAIGFASTEFSGLVGSDNRRWSFGSSINLPIFNLGNASGNLTVAQTRKVAAQEREKSAQRQIAELARIRYNEGVVRYLEVLDAERNLFAAEQALRQLRRAEVENLVTSYIALGGGAIDQR